VRQMMLPTGPAASVHIVAPHPQPSQQPPHPPPLLPKNPSPEALLESTGENRWRSDNPPQFDREEAKLSISPTATLPLLAAPRWTSRVLEPPREKDRFAPARPPACCAVAFASSDGLALFTFSLASISQRPPSTRSASSHAFQSIFIPLQRRADGWRCATTRTRCSGSHVRNSSPKQCHPHNAPTALSQPLSQQHAIS
jgi:hypothetical protein